MPGPIQAPVFIVNCDSATIEASIEVSGDWSVEWSNGTQGTLTQYHNEGAGEVTLYGGLSCEEKYQFNLPSIPHLNPLQIWVDTSILENHTLKVDLNLDPNEWTVEWTPASIFSCPTCLSTIIQPTTNTSVTANLLHSSGCPYTLSFSITLEEIVHLYIPNVFSPNGDGINDEWIVSSPGDQIEIVKLDIFDRWGNHLYHGANLHKAVWNGRFRDQLLNPGVFAYTITYRDQENKTQTETGNITLAR
jgi:gliding motility-associated-like protein